VFAWRVSKQESASAPTTMASVRNIRNGAFADDADHERAPALHRQLAQIRPQPDTRERQEECHRDRLARWSSDRRERAGGGQPEIARKPRTNFGNFFPQKRGLPRPRAPGFCAPSRGRTRAPRSNGRIARCLREHREFAAASEYNAPAAVASAVLSTARPTHSPYA